MSLVTSRLRLRPWRDDDIDAWFEINRDPEVMKFFPALLDREAALTSLERINAFIIENGYGLWAVEVLGGAPFIGFCGIRDVPFEAPFTPAVEIGWRLARAHWGHGYATEGARAALAHGFDTLGRAEIIAMLVPENHRSIAVCERLGMIHDPSGDFDHPRIPADAVSVGGYSPRRHTLYRLTRERYEQLRAH
ncbi:MAG TPA: GNAT family N-acetyltransferase [Kofleriaceae bacterium]